MIRAKAFRLTTFHDTEGAKSNGVAPLLNAMPQNPITPMEAKDVLRDVWSPRLTRRRAGALTHTRSTALGSSSSARVRLRFQLLGGASASAND